MASKNNNMREVYQEKNTLIGKSIKRASQTRDSSGNMIKDEASRPQRWAECSEGLLNAEEPDELIDFSSYTPAEEIDISQDPPSREELDKAIGLLKRKKSTWNPQHLPRAVKRRWKQHQRMATPYMQTNMASRIFTM